jgi:hypothetical protein
VKAAELEKIMQAAARMDDGYWEAAAGRMSALSNLGEHLAAQFIEAQTALLIAQVNLLEARHQGYVRLAECAKTGAGETEIAEATSASRNLIGQLKEKKRLAVADIAGCLKKLKVIAEESEKLGEDMMALGQAKGDEKP